MSPIRIFCFACLAFWSMAPAASAALITHFNEDFEGTDVSGSSTPQFDGYYANNTVPGNGSWVGATQGFGATRRGLINAASSAINNPPGDYSSPAGNLQAYYFGYTNSGLTTSVAGLSDGLDLERTYILSFLLASDNTEAFSTVVAELVSMDGVSDAARTEARGARPGDILASINTSTATLGFTSVSLVFTPDLIGNASHAGIPLAIRFLGNSRNPIIDNVSLVSVPEPSTMVLLLAMFGGLGIVIRRRANTKRTE